jgi:hypothetical protein
MLFTVGLASKARMEQGQTLQKIKTFFWEKKIAGPAQSDFGLYKGGVDKRKEMSRGNLSLTAALSPFFVEKRGEKTKSHPPRSCSVAPTAQSRKLRHVEWAEAAERS